MGKLLISAFIPASILLAACTGEGTQTVNSTSGSTMATLPANTTLTLTAHQGLEAASISNGAAVLTGAPATVVVQSAPSASYVTSTNGFNLTLPDSSRVVYSNAAGSSNLIATQTYSATVQNGTNTVVTTFTDGAASPLTYSTYGMWTESDKTGNPLSVGVFVPGILTATTQVPTTGTANYSGNITGFVATATTTAAITGGTVSLIANFANKTIDGTVTNIATQAINGGPVGQLNNLFLNTGTISTNSFNGVAAPAAAIATTTVNIAGATGTFGGHFYGPNAAEAGGSIALTGGGNTVIAAFGAKQ